MRKIKRTFIPGNEWIYFKIYASSSNCENLLIKEIYPISKYLMARNLIDYWFFIKYQDPNFHLRVRFHFNDKTSNAKIIYLIYKRLNKYVNTSVVNKITIDTYVREVERYKLDLMDFAENIFHIDSIAICNLLKMVKSKENQEIDRLLIGIKIIDIYLSSFGIKIKQKHQFTTLSDNLYRNEFGFNSLKYSGINEIYRKYKSQIEMFFNYNITENCQYYSDIFSMLSNLEDNISKLSGQLKTTQRTLIDQRLMGSYIHMSLNRLFQSKNRVYEMLSYNFITRLYISKMAILGGKTFKSSYLL